MARYVVRFVRRFLEPWNRHDVENAELEEIEDLAAEILGKAQEAQSIEDDLICILYVTFR